jgi:RNA polymerase sigma-70 factor (ECF subfamily)
MDDSALLAAAPRDPEAFGVFYDRHVDHVLAFFAARTRGADVALDLTAETFARALESLASAGAPAHAGTGSWLFTIARNLLVDSYRRGAVDDRARRRLGALRISATDEDLEKVDQRASAAAPGLRALLDDLPAEQRDAIEARVVRERSYAEIAEELACSESVVRQRVSRGLRRLRLELKRGSV